MAKKKTALGQGRILVSEPKTKVVDIELAALTRLDWGAVVQIPAGLSDDDRQTLLEKFYDQIDGGEYTSDNDYWEKGLQSIEDIDLRVEYSFPDFYVDEHLNIYESELDCAAAQCGLTNDDLDDLVHDTVSHYGSDVNNSGIAGQLAFLAKQLGEEAALKLIRATGERLKQSTQDS